eukprot:COSAG01_NODE_7009_length_3393_cov_1452.441409_2_plen_32_part_00
MLTLSYTKVYKEQGAHALFGCLQTSPSPQCG